MKPVDQSAHDREMAAHDDVKRVPEIPRNHCPSSAKCAIDHSPPAGRRATDQGRCRPQRGAHFYWDRGCQRHHRRSGSGSGRRNGLVLLGGFGAAHVLRHHT